MAGLDPAPHLQKMQSHTKRRNDRLSNPVMAGLVPAITTRTELAKGAIPVSKHPTEMAGTSSAMTGFAARALRQQQRRLVSYEAAGIRPRFTTSSPSPVRLAANM